MADPNFIEEWRSVPDWEGFYSASSLGRIRNDRNQYILKPVNHSEGYLSVRLSRVGLHSLVAAAFLGPRPNGMDVKHKDNDKKNNRADNLSYGTHAENCLDSWKDGLTKQPPPPEKGSKNRLAKLKEADIPAIREMLVQGCTLQAIGDRFGVTKQAIRAVKIGITHIKP